MILPGATLGVLGGGQLGSMFTAAACTLGYHVTVLDPDPNSPAARFADKHLRARYDDRDALEELGKTCAAVTVEFENVPAQSLELLASHCIVRPAARAVAIAQDRITEKTFLQQQGFPVAPFIVVGDTHALHLPDFPFPAILKRSRLGYDGKGQMVVRNRQEALAAFNEFNQEPCVLEQRLPLQREISVILTRGADDAIACFPVAENQHANGILDVSIAPARFAASLARKALAMAEKLARSLEYCGVLAVEFFVLEGDRLVVNEIAPRPHNSGHYTLDACVTSQFEQQVRALCGLPLGGARLLSPAVMVNLLGDLWAEGEPRWEEVLQHPQVKLHLYGKSEPRAGRKMGHFTCLDASVEQALATALQIKSRILPHSAAANTGQRA